MRPAALRPAIAILSVAVSWQVIAQAPQQGVRVRGTIEKVDGNVLSVKSTDGHAMRIALSDDARIISVIKASLADIKPGSFVGSAAIPQPDGSQKALEVHIFPEAMRGTGEGHRPYFIPNSTMTNGTVGNAVKGVDGNTVMLSYKGGEKKIVVAPGVPVVRYEIGGRGDLKPGAAFTVLSAVKKPDGTFTTSRVNVGRDGAVPQ
ncbi:MAG TPA: hypothetical protein VJO54_15995 [Burkholderiales bacterium]|nr:hypothetical protein [Burkholderiales bacterium]